MRWLSVLLRAVHLAFVLALGIVLHSPESLTYQYEIIVATGLSGVALLAMEMSNKLFFAELAGLSMMAKLCMIASMAIWMDQALVLYWLIILWSAFFAHAPRTFRHKRWK